MNNEDAKLIREVLQAGINVATELPQQLTALVSLHKMVDGHDE